MENNYRYTPIMCPRCHSLNLAFTEEYHIHYLASIISYTAAVLALLIAAISFFYEMLNQFIAVIAILAIISIIAKIAKILGESKTHTKGICKDCGLIWIIK